jgi:ubiquinone/menaquinone biosynthesis C-methylase UbiE
MSNSQTASTPSLSSSTVNAHFSTAITEFYDARAPNYDNEPGGFHTNLAKDIIALASGFVPFPPVKILDLCCGTGLVTFAARSHFGPGTLIHGVDLSTVSLNIAQKKAKEAGDDRIQFFEGSATDLAKLNLEEESYDLIICCSALVLLGGDLTAVLRDWSGYLKQGGILIFDVPAPGTQILSALASEVMATRGAPAVDRGEVDGEGRVRELIKKSGLKVKDVVNTRVYKTDILRVEEAEEKWRGMVKHKIYDVSALSQNEQDEARIEFVRQVRQKVGKNSVLKDDYRLVVGIAAKEG